MTPLSPSDRLIVALDVPNLAAWRLVDHICANTDVRFFKLSPSNFLHQDYGRSGKDLIRLIHQHDGHVMLDLKVYDTPDSVRRIIESAFMAGARFVTVHPDCVVPARRVYEALLKEEREGLEILPVLELTTNTTTTFDENDEFKFALFATGAAVCPSHRVAQVRKLFPSAILVCPGIRATADDSSGHAEPWAPAAAIHAGADYLVVGRPITEASNPVTAVREIVGLMENERFVTI